MGAEPTAAAQAASRGVREERASAAAEKSWYLQHTHSWKFEQTHEPTHTDTQTHEYIYKREQ
jgi:hypothetical protein